MNFSLPRISIITPSLNQGDFIEQTILSVLKQGYPDLEYIVIDGGSTDNTLDILRKYEHQLSWISEPDLGQSHAINKGLRMATGQIVAYLNSDDLYQPKALIRVGEAFAHQPKAEWLTGKCYIIDVDNHEIRKIITRYKNFWLKLKSYQVLLILDYISQPATFWRRSIVDEVGFFDESLFYTLDYDYSLRVGRCAKLWVIDAYLASFRIHTASKTTYSTSKQFHSDLEVAKRYSSSILIRYLHTLHNLLIISIYKSIFIRDSPPYPG